LPIDEQLESAAAARAVAAVPGEIAYFEGAFVPLAEARLPITTHAFNYGTGCFEGIRAYWNASEEQLYVLRLAEHAERLVASSRILGLDFELPAVTLAALLLELLARNGYREDAYVRPIVYKSGETITVRLGGVATSFCAYTLPLGEYLPIDRCLTVSVSTWRRPDDNALPSRAKPTGAYLNAALASSEARGRGFDEAIMLTSDGHVAEAASANLFLVRAGRLVTPPASDDILVGITRDSVLALAGELGVPAEERRVDRSELFDSDELFLCGTGVQIAPVGGVDGRPIGSGEPGPVTSELQRTYLEIGRGVSARFPAWRTPVY
jgi:branched-chain amino acid aminotransferase